MDAKNIIVIGASAGGLKAVGELLAHLEAGLPIAIFVVIHVSKRSSVENICQYLQKRCSYTCLAAANDQKIEAGGLYVAPPDTHLFLKPGYIRLTTGPHENRWRPSVDVLFRSAAAAYGSRVIGIVLTGTMHDGTSGMSAIKRSGGVCMIQDPAEAEFMEMPVNVLNNIGVDYQLPVAGMGVIIAELLAKPGQPEVPIPEEVKIEAEITERMTSDIDQMEKIATHSNYTCPDCGGGLWKINDDPAQRYRCHTGHVYTEPVLLDKQSEQIEESVWVSIRMIEERRNVLQNIAKRETETGRPSFGENYRRRATELNEHIERLKQLLVAINKAEPDTDGYL